MNALVLPVKDVKGCAIFYRDKLGFALDELHEEDAYLRIGGPGGQVLALKSLDLVAKEISEDRIKPGQETVKRTHFVAFGKDVDAEYEALKQNGVHFVNAPSTKDGGWRTSHFEDPEGNLWEISQRPAK